MTETEADALWEQEQRELAEWDSKFGHLSKEEQQRIRQLELLSVRLEREMERQKKWSPFRRLVYSLVS